MADSSWTGTGDGVTTTYPIPFSYLRQAFVKVEVNSIDLLTPGSWYFSSGSVVFRTAPADGASIKIRRETQGDTRMVNFQDGAVLSEAELDLSADQLFHLLQETQENWSDLVNAELIRIGSGNGVISVETDEIIAGLVVNVLEDAVALNLSQRVQDIDDNAESILGVSTTLQSQINALAQATAATVFVQAAEPVPGVGGVPDPIPDGARWYDSDDNNHPYIYDQGATAWVDLEDPRIAANESDIVALDARLTTEEGLSTGVASSISALNATVYDAGSGVAANASAITQLQTDVSGNTAAITTEQTARSDGDSALAADIALIGAANGAQTAFILDSSTVKIDSDVGDTIATRLSALATADSDNAANITTEQSARITADGVIADELHLLGAMNGAETAFILDTATVKLDSDAGVTVAAKFSSLVAADGANAASITSEETARITADGVIASDIALMGARNAGQTAFIFDSSTVKIDTDAGQTFAQRFSTLAAADSANSASISTIQTVTIPGVESDVSDLEARYGVSLNVNGYVTGFVQNNDGSTGNFVILADKFAIVDPTGDPEETEFVPFSVSGGVVTMQNVVISGNLFVGGHIASGDIGTGEVGTGNIATDAVTDNEILVGQLSDINVDLGSITAGDITLDTAGFIRGGQTAFATGTGFFLGYEASQYKFSVGNTTDFIKWDGTSLIVRGNISLGNYVASTTELLLAANTERNSSVLNWVEVKKFEVNRPGTVQMYLSYKVGSTSGGQVNPSEYRVKVDGSVESSLSFFNATYASTNFELTLPETVQYVTLEYKSGERNPSEPQPCGVWVKDVQLKAIKSDGEIVITD